MRPDPRQRETPHGTSAMLKQRNHRPQASPTRAETARPEAGQQKGAIAPHRTAVAERRVRASFNRAQRAWRECARRARATRSPDAPGYAHARHRRYVARHCAERWQEGSSGEPRRNCGVTMYSSRFVPTCARGGRKRERRPLSIVLFSICVFTMVRLGDANLCCIVPNVSEDLRRVS